MNPPALPKPSTTAAATRERRLPATGLPVKREERRGWGLLSALLHALLIALLITPFATHDADVVERPQGAGGLGPMGGGGGGKRGTGGSTEHVTYVKVTPPPAAAVAAVIPPPTIQPEPVIPPPQAIKPPEPTPEVKPEVKAEVTPPVATAPTPGTGGGTGRDGSAGTGPGSGGGTGAGIGTGRGSGNGPGTGGGVQANFPPVAIEVFIPPLPMPSSVRGLSVVVEFDVDETGKVLSFGHKAVPDRGYNKRLDDVLNNTKFRPGTTPDGKPIRMKVQMTYDFGG